MERALNTVAKRLPEGGTMPAQAQHYIESLKADNTQKAYGYTTHNMNPNAIANNKSTDKINYVPFNVVDGAVDSIKSSNSDLSDGQAFKIYTQENLKPGAVSSYG